VGGSVDPRDLFSCPRYSDLFGMAINYKSIYRLTTESNFTVMKISDFEVMFKEFKAV
jgi:hypothetical protein